MTTKTIVWGALLVAAAPTARAADELPFAALTFEEAEATAREQDRLLLVDVMTTWCPPCKRMEAEVWPDGELVAWIDEHALAIQVDGDERRDLVAAWDIEAYPTMLAWKDGEVYDRLRGYADADELLAWLDAARALDEPLTEDDRLAELEASTDMFDAMERKTLARELMDAGRHDDALRHYVWLWRESLDHDPAFVGVRGSFLVGEIGRLVSEHEPAREVFEVFYDEAQVAIDAGDASAWSDWQDLGPLFGQDDDVVVEWYDAHRDEDGSLPSRYWTPSITRDVFDDLVARDRWAEAGMVLRAPHLDAVGRLGMASAIAQLSGEEESAWADAREEVGTLYAALIAAGRRDDAARTADAVFERRDTPDMRLALVDGLHRAGLADDRAEAFLEHASRRGADVEVRRRRQQSLEAIAAGATDVVPFAAFRDLTFDEAVDLAQREGKLLVVFVTAWWDDGARDMDEQTWSHLDVIEWLVEHAVAIRADYGDVPEVDVDGLPAVVVRSEGEQIGRFEGFRTPTDTLAWLEELRLQRSLVVDDELAAELEAGLDPLDVHARLALVERFARGRRPDLALEHLSWVWEHGRAADARWDTRGLAACAEAVAWLAAEHEPARDLFLAELERVEQRARDGDRVAWKDFVALSGALDERQRVASWVSEPGGRPLTLQQERDVVGLLVDDAEWAAAGLVPLDAVAFVERALDGRDDDRAAALGEAAALHAALVAAGRHDDAARTAERILADDDAVDARLALVEGLFAALLAPDVALSWLDELDELGVDTYARRRRHAAIRRDGY